MPQIQSTISAALARLDPQGAWAVELRRTLTEYVEHEDVRVKQAAVFWLAGLGALAKLLRAPGDDPHLLGLQAAELFVRGSRYWFEVLGEQTRALARNKKAIFATPEGIDVLHRLARLSVDLEAALEGDEDAARRIANALDPMGGPEPCV